MVMSVSELSEEEPSDVLDMFDESESSDDAGFWLLSEKLEEPPDPAEDPSADEEVSELLQAQRVARITMQIIIADIFLIFINLVTKTPPCRL